MQTCYILVLVTTTERLTQKLCMSHKVIIHIAKFIHCLCIWILYIYNFFPFKNREKLLISACSKLAWGWDVNVCLLVLSCITNALCHLMSILHGNNSQPFLGLSLCLSLHIIYKSITRRKLLDFPVVPCVDCFCPCSESLHISSEFPQKLRYWR